jgi:hypothetical protein
VTHEPFDAARERIVHGGDERCPSAWAFAPARCRWSSRRATSATSTSAGAKWSGGSTGGARPRLADGRPALGSSQRGADTFRCRYHAEHRQDAVAFGWDATIEGAADGTLTFAFDGVAESTFERNRIGLCLLHPLPALSGARVRVTTSGGANRLLAFPDLVTVEQPIAGFDDIATLSCEIGADLWLEATVEGDVFQAEDRRNWIDAFGIYDTPVIAEAGDGAARHASRASRCGRTARGDAARLADAARGRSRRRRCASSTDGRLPRSASARRARSSTHGGASARRSGSRRQAIRRRSRHRVASLRPRARAAPARRYRRGGAGARGHRPRRPRRGARARLHDRPRHDPTRHPRRRARLAGAARGPRVRPDRRRHRQRLARITRAGAACGADAVC